MIAPGTVQKPVDSIEWQDYRSANKGMVVYYNTDPVSEIPIREVPESYPTDIDAEPNYETGTYGVYGCVKPKIRSAFYKAKLRYMFFMSKYEGNNVDLLDQILITGFYRVKRTADVKKLHMRYLAEFGCINDETCIAFRADEVRFVGATDAFVITPEILQKWGVSGRITRQTRILLDEENTAKLIEYLGSRKDCTAQYVAETRRLSPDAEEEDEEAFEDADAEAIAQGDRAGALHEGVRIAPENLPQDESLHPEDIIVGRDVEDDVPDSIEENPLDEAQEDEGQRE